MSKPNEHKTVQARILAYAQEIGWSLVPREEAERRRGLNHKERRDRKGVSHSASLSSLRSLRFSISGFRGLDRRERRDRKEDLDRAIWQQAGAIFPCREFWHRLCQNLATACRQILEPAVQEMDRAPEIP